MATTEKTTTATAYGAVERTGRICPHVHQQCLQRRGCAVFAGDELPDDRIVGQLIAFACHKRGEFLFTDELKDKHFDRGAHPDEARDRYSRAQRSKLHTARRRRDQLELPLEKEVPMH